MKIALVDDEKQCLDEMERLCRDFGAHSGIPVETVSFPSGEAFLDAFESGGFSIVFMDIYLDGIDGVSAALKMRAADSRCILIFLTSATEFMPDAFSCHAFEYVTKPFSRRRIFGVLRDAAKLLPQTSREVELTNGRTSVRAPLDAVSSVVTDAHYLDITLRSGETLRCRMTMAEFLKKTDGDARFLSVNKGITVNVEHIFTFEDGCCVMESGARFPVRVRDRAAIEQAAQDYHFEKIRRRQAHFADGRHRKED